MNVISYTALGKKLLDFTFFDAETSKFCVKMMCPSFHSFSHRLATSAELRKLKTPLRIVNAKTPRLNVTRVRVYHSQKSNPKHDYKRFQDINYFEDRLAKVANHYPELSIFLIKTK